MDASNFTPEQIQQLIQMGILDDEGSALDTQMAQAEALRQPDGHNYTSPWGAALGGIGGVVNTLNSGFQEKDIRKKQQENAKKKAEGRGLFAKGFGLGRQPQPVTPGIDAPVAMDQGAGPTYPSDPYGYGYIPGKY